MTTKKCQYYILLAFIFDSVHPQNTLHSCKDLCQLCIDNEDCRRSIGRLSGHCASHLHEIGCNSNTQDNCVSEFRSVEHFLTSKNGFWCRNRQSHGKFGNSNQIILRCIDLVQSGSLSRLCSTADNELIYPIRLDQIRNVQLKLQPVSASQGADKNDYLPSQRRTTRSPDRIQRWKKELSLELASFSKVLPVTSCQSALHDLCLRHISCRELWKIFRQTCVVDAQNQCQMTNRNDCWQAFEGISWTGLGTCGCFDNNSDCQFIRLQTNYNKCIYEIRNSGSIPVAESSDRFGEHFVASFTTPLPSLNPTWHDSAMSDASPDVILPSGHSPVQSSSTVMDRTEAWRPADNQLSEFKRRQNAEAEAQRRRQAAELADANRRHQEVLLQYEERIRQRERHLEEERQRLNQQQSQLQSHPAIASGSWTVQAKNGMTEPLETSRSAGESMGSAQPSRTKIKSPYSTTVSVDTKRPVEISRPTNNTELIDAVTPTETKKPSESSQLTEPTGTSGPVESQLITPPTPSIMALNRGPTSEPSRHRWRVYNTKATIHKWRQNHLSFNIVTTTTTTTTTITPPSRKEISSTISISVDPDMNSYESTATSTSRSLTVKLTQSDTVADQPKKSVEDDVISTKSSLVITTTEDPTETQLITPFTDPVSTAATNGNSTRKRPKAKRPKAYDSEDRRDWNSYKSQLIVSAKSPFGVAVAAKSAQGESTCREAYRRCEEDSETCRWHLSELQIKCTEPETTAAGAEDRRCSRDHCAKAMGRFSRYVPRQAVESLMFCQCAFGDGECRRLQQWMYPRCLYTTLRNRPRHTCTETIQFCETDVLCNRQLHSLNSSCPVELNGGHRRRRRQDKSAAPRCAAASHTLSSCRTAMIGARGGHLETPCFCEATDDECRAHQAIILPNNPCIEAAVMDYAATNTQQNSTKSGVGVDSGDFIVGVTEVTVMPAVESRETVDGETLNYSPKEQYEMVGLEAAEILSRENVAPNKNDIEVMEIDLSDSNATVTDATIAEESTVTAMAPATVATTRTSTKKSEAKSRILEKQSVGLPTGAFVTQRPPPAGGCATRNIDGEWIVHYKDSLFRNYEDWSGRCSSWCECNRAEKMKCRELGCLVDVHCEAPHATVGFGERLYLEGRGACQCQSGKFICDTSEEIPILEPGLYISLGYSKEELSLLKEKVPTGQLERSGLVSPAASVAKDIATRLQFALERVLPKGILCRIAVLEHFVQESVIMYQIQYYGINHFANETQPKWHVGRMEKTCAPYVQELEHVFMLEKADRYQLILSTVKQLRVIDRLDGLPTTPAVTVATVPSFSGLTQISAIYCILASFFCIFGKTLWCFAILTI